MKFCFCTFSTDPKEIPYTFGVSDFYSNDSLNLAGEFCQLSCPFSLFDLRPIFLSVLPEIIGRTLVHWQREYWLEIG